MKSYDIVKETQISKAMCMFHLLETPRNEIIENTG